MKKLALGITLMCALMFVASTNVTHAQPPELPQWDYRSEAVERVLHIIGSTGALLAFPANSEPFVTLGNQHTFSWQNNPRFEAQGVVPVVVLNGVNQGAESPDHPYWTPSTNGQDTPFSVVVWIKPDADQISANIFGKYRIDGPEIREWLLQQENPSGVIGVLRDENTNGGFKPRYTEPLDTEWHQLAIVYDGQGQLPGFNVYKNGVLVTNSHTAYANFNRVQDTIAPVILGYTYYSGGLIEPVKGKIAGGACGPVFTKKALTEGELQILHNVCQREME